MSQGNSKKSKQNIPSYFNNIWIILGVICTIGFLLRIIWIPHEAPLTLDSGGYFWYAIETSITGSFPNSECGWRCTFPNTGWSSFLSIFFMIFSFDNYIVRGFLLGHTIPKCFKMRNKTFVKVFAKHIPGFSSDISSIIIAHCDLIKSAWIQNAILDL